MSSSLCPKAVFGSLNSTVSTSLANLGSSNVQTSCHGLEFRTRVGLQSRNAGELACYNSLPFFFMYEWNPLRLRMPLLACVSFRSSSKVRDTIAVSR